MITDNSPSEADLKLFGELLSGDKELLKSYKEVIDSLVRNLNTVVDSHNELHAVTKEAIDGYETAVTLVVKAIDLCRRSILNPATEQERRMEILNDILGFSQELQAAHSSLKTEFNAFSDKLPSV